MRHYQGDYKQKPWVDRAWSRISFAVSDPHAGKTYRSAATEPSNTSGKSQKGREKEQVTVSYVKKGSVVSQKQQ